MCDEFSWSQDGYAAKWMEDKQVVVATHDARRLAIESCLKNEIVFGIAAHR